MILAAIGVNYQTAPLSIREKASFSSKAYPEHLSVLSRLPAVEEVMLLSTCNRTEIYARTQDVTVIQHWLSDRLGISPPEMHHKYGYLHRNDAAIAHALRVGNGLDSMAVGETQILGQLKEAYRMALQTGSLGRELQRLFQYVFSASKQIRSLAHLNTHPISLAFVALTLAKRLFSNLSESRALILGTGQVSELVGHYLQGHGISNITVLSRSTEKAKRLAAKWQGEGAHLSTLEQVLPQADFLISATASPLPLVTHDHLEKALKQRKRKPMLVIDLASPRDVDAQARSLEDIYLYDIDDLQAVIEHNFQQRKACAFQAEAMIEAHVHYYLHRLKLLNAKSTIEKLRQYSEVIRDETLKKALEALNRGGSPHETMTQLAHTLMNKWLHEPCVQLREAGLAQDNLLLCGARQLFQLPDDE